MFGSQKLLFFFSANCRIVTTVFCIFYQTPSSSCIMSFYSLCCQADNRKRYKEEENDHLDDQTAADLAWSKHKLLNESIIVALFQGQFKSTLQCLTCHRKSRTFETFMYLSLPLASTSKCSLQVNKTLTCAEKWKSVFSVSYQLVRTSQICLY